MAGPSLKADQETRTLKFNVPTDIHTKLWGLRTLRGKPVAETLEEALEAYFEVLKDEHDLNL